MQCPSHFGALLLSTTLAFGCVRAQEVPSVLSAQEQTRDFWLVNLAGMGIITAYGTANWDYFSRRPHTRYEGWFAHDTDYGGADKLGHMYTTYVLSRTLGALYEERYFVDPELYGALSAGIIMSYTELGDAFSKFGFAYEDIVANCTGAMLGYLLGTHPQLSKRVDLRWEYDMNRIGGDFVTDYSHAKYLLAFKLGGFDLLDDTPMKYLELHTGYFTRGYTKRNEPDERMLYIGLGLNLSDLFRTHNYTIPATILNYYQIPQTYLYSETVLTH